MDYRKGLRILAIVAVIGMSLHMTYMVWVGMVEPQRFVQVGFTFGMMYMCVAAYRQLFKKDSQ